LALNGGIRSSDIMRKEQLPIESDFYTHNGDLDGKHAWECFGGLTLEQAREQFLGNPEFHQEDFMFMGGKAFAYYFPVIEGYLKSVAVGESTSDYQMWILSHAIRNHFDGVDLPYVRYLIPRVLALAEWVLGNNVRINRYDCEERERVADGWEGLVRHIKSQVLPAEDQ
jgi:hypothetical protein